MTTSIKPTFASYDDLGLFETVDLLPPLKLPNNLLARQEAAAAHGDVATVLELADEWSNERADRSVSDIQADGPHYRWSNTPAGPKNEAGDGCRPHILSVDLRCRHYRETCSCVGDLIYRHTCIGCGHVDDPRTSENAAVEGAMDHAWPGWRDLPILACAMPEEAKQRTKWLDAARAHYPDGWIENGGPVRTARDRVGSRHVPNRTPYRGYDLGAIVTDGHYLNHRYKAGLYEPTLTDQLTTDQETP